jgi:hypothetical protein
LAEEAVKREKEKRELIMERKKLGREAGFLSTIHQILFVL